MPTLDEKIIENEYKHFISINEQYEPYEVDRLVELISYNLESVPFDGTLSEREEFIKTTVEELWNKDKPQD